MPRHRADVQIDVSVVAEILDVALAARHGRNMDDLGIAGARRAGLRQNVWTSSASVTSADIPGRHCPPADGDSEDVRSRLFTGLAGSPFVSSFTGRVRA
jgi:hypothetical protein